MYAPAADTKTGQIAPIMKTFLSLLAVTLAEATIGVFVKLTGDAVPIFTLNFYRVLFAAFFLGVAMTFINTS
ncbi:hypothetical protein BRC21_01070, partial [Candidatus Saccharibacteria bacterium SW_7_54_9]